MAQRSVHPAVVLWLLTKHAGPGRLQPPNPPAPHLGRTDETRPTAARLLQIFAHRLAENSVKRQKRKEGNAAAGCPERGAQRGLRGGCCRATRQRGEPPAGRMMDCGQQQAGDERCAARGGCFASPEGFEVRTRARYRVTLLLVGRRLDMALDRLSGQGRSGGCSGN